MNADPMLEDARRAYNETCCERLPILEAVDERRERATWSWVVSWVVSWIGGFDWSFAVVGTGESAGNGSVLSDADIAAIVAERIPNPNSQVNEDYNKAMVFAEIGRMRLIQNQKSWQMSFGSQLHVHPVEI